MARKDQPDLFSDAPVDYRKPIKSGRTAMHRKTPSPIARSLLGIAFFEKHHIRTVLDYGCGVGRDVAFYMEHGFEAEGYDPCPAFGWNTRPVGTFDLVVNLFVFNVIAEVSERQSLAQTLMSFVGSGGILIVAARSPATITGEAAKKAWKSFRDGYLSSPSRGTFQKGISRAELLAYFDFAKFEAIDVNIPISSDVTCVCLRRLSGRQI